MQPGGCWDTFGWIVGSGPRAGFTINSAWDRGTLVGLSGYLINDIVSIN
jgi:hypothetical protein